jgi:H+/Cl- antiporter ClcA
VITLKSTVVYAAYDQLGRWWGVAPLKDELLGGLILWIAASMMGLIAVLLLVRLWGQSESRSDLRRQQGFPMLPRTEAHMDGHDDRAARAARSRDGWTLALIPLTVFAAVIVLAVWLASQSHPPRPATSASMLRFIEHPQAAQRPSLDLQAPDAGMLMPRRQPSVRGST